AALSYVGLVPAALLGMDVNKLLDQAKNMMLACGPTTPEEWNPALHLGAVMGTLAKAGRDKLTLVVSDKISTFGYWIEQLVAESTGKEGVGILPVEGEPLGTPAVYGKDRLFVYLRLGANAGRDKAVAALARAGQPVIELQLMDAYALGAEFIRWEIATAVAGWALGIDPFDQPNVQESKDNTVRLLKEHESKGQFSDADGVLSADGRDFPVRFLAHLKSIKPSDYVALTAYLERTPRREKLLRDLRTAIRDKFKAATTVGYGPRFLHSTGQLHKGGGGNGVFIQFSCDDPQDA